MLKSAIKIISVYATLYCAVGAVAQELYDIPLKPNPGDRLSIDYVHERNRNGQIVVVDFDAEIIVDAAYDDRFVATWTTHSARIGDLEIVSSDPQAVDYLLGVPIRYIADMDGTPVRIEDKNRMLDSMFDGQLFEMRSEQEIASVGAFFDSLSEEALAQLFLKVPTYMALCQGVSLQLGEWMGATVQTPSPIGGAPVAADISYLLESFDSGTSTAHIEYRMGLDPESAKQMTMALMRQAGVDDESTMAEVAGTNVERNDTAACDVDIDHGWVEEITFFNELKVPGQFQSERFVVSAQLHSQ